MRPASLKEREGIGRSRGGLTSKIHALCDGLGRPFALMLTGGQASDLEGFDALVSRIEAGIVIGDKGYDADERVRAVLAGLGKCGVIPPRKGRNNPATYDKELYKYRHRIENLFSRLKDYRCVATRYDKRAVNFLSGVYLAAALIWII